MSGKCLQKLPHSCGTSDGLQVFAREEDDTVDGYCFSCGTYVRNPFNDKEVKVSALPAPKLPSKEEVEAKLKEIGSYKTVSIEARKLRASSLRPYGVKVELSEKDGTTPMVRYYPYKKDGEIVAYKAKAIHKKHMWWVGSSKDVDFFGWEEAIGSGSKKLIICTGEDDVIAIHRAYDRCSKEEYKDQTPAIISVISGDRSAVRELVAKRDEIQSRFKEIVLAFDMDDSGQRAAEEVSRAFPEATVASLPAKDANQALMDGKYRALFTSIQFNAKRKKNSKLVWAHDIWEEAAKPAEWGELTWPWPTIQDLTRGIRYGETIYIGGGVKMGKSAILNSIAGHIIQNCDEKVCLIKPEEAKSKTLKLMAGQLAGAVFHDPKIPFDEKKYMDAREIAKGKMLMFTMYQDIKWEGLKSDIIDAVHMGCKAVFIDPITNLTNGMDPSVANVKLQEVAQSLAQMALDYNIVVFIFCHLKAPEGNLSHDQRAKAYEQGRYIDLGNCPHELGGSVLSAQFAGSRAMMRSCNYMLGLEGNKDDNLPDDIRNSRRLTLLEDREFGEVGSVKLKWQPETTWLVEAGQWR